MASLVVPAIIASTVISAVTSVTSLVLSNRGNDVVEIPDAGDPEVERARDTRKRVLAGQFGKSNTILTSPTSEDPATRPATILG